jgi:hypothetical protein
MMPWRGVFARGIAAHAIGRLAALRLGIRREVALDDHVTTLSRSASRRVAAVTSMSAISKPSSPYGW